MTHYVIQTMLADGGIEILHPSKEDFIAKCEEQAYRVLSGEIKCFTIHNTQESTVTHYMIHVTRTDATTFLLDLLTSESFVHECAYLANRVAIGEIKCFTPYLK